MLYVAQDDRGPVLLLPSCSWDYRYAHHEGRQFPVLTDRTHSVDQTGLELSYLPQGSGDRYMVPHQATTLPWIPSSLTYCPPPCSLSASVFQTFCSVSPRPHHLNSGEHSPCLLSLPRSALSPVTLNSMVICGVSCPTCLHDLQLQCEKSSAGPSALMSHFLCAIAECPSFSL